MVGSFLLQNTQYTKKPQTPSPGAPKTFSNPISLFSQELIMYVVFYWEVRWFNIMDKSIVASQKSMQNMRSTAYMFILYISNHEQQKPEIQNL